MSVLTTSLFLACCIAFLGNVSAKIGEFKAANGYMCVYDVAKHGHCRELKINCRKKNTASYNCVYSGDPHNCGAYNKNANKLNNAFVKILGNDGLGACNRASIEAIKVCPGVVYNRRACAGTRTVLEEIILKEMEFDGY